MIQTTVLLVEDDFLNRRLTKKILLDYNFQVLEAKNAEEALQILHKENLDIAILDIHLGEDKVDGISLAQQIQAKYKIPFIFLTAFENVEIANKAMLTNPYSYLTKPFKNIELISSIKIALRQYVNEDNLKPMLIIKDNGYNVTLAIDEIEYLESEKNYVMIFTKNNKFKCRSTLKLILEKLPQNNFIQIHRAFIVNKKKITKYNTKCVIVNNVEIPISTNYVSNLRK